MIITGQLDVGSIPAKLSEFIISTVVDWFVVSFVRPVVGSILWIAGLFIDTILLVAFGPDRAIGGSPGLADFALFLAGEFIDMTAPVATEIITTIVQVNETIAAVAAEAGIAAPIVVSALVLLELAVTAYIAWSIIRVINVPLVDLDAIILRVTGPFRAILRRLN
ncbi:hypothetical protein [Natronomonas marina]|uniref:hypothetical protein n=1 Tax=Natronomonas marina TaxID=2961939 RepID=UPI0020C97AC9|nr:hypothetical protein [Natronomonas marina]